MTTLLDFFKARRPQDFVDEIAAGESPAEVMARGQSTEPTPAANPYADQQSSDSSPAVSPQAASGGGAPLPGPPAAVPPAPPPASPDHFGNELNGQQSVHEVTPQQATKSVEPQSERAPTRMERIADWYATKQAALEKEAGAAMQGLDAEEKRNRAQSAVNALKLRQEAVGAMVTRDYGGADSLLGRASEVEQHAMGNPDARREQLQRFYESRRGQLSGEAGNMIAQQREEDQLAATIAKDRKHEEELAAENKGLDAILLNPENNAALPEGLRSPEAIKAMPHEEKKQLAADVQQSLNRKAQQGFQQSQQARAEGFQAGQQATSQAFQQAQQVRGKQMDVAVEQMKKGLDAQKMIDQGRPLVKELQANFDKLSKAELAAHRFLNYDTPGMSEFAIKALSVAERLPSVETGGVSRAEQIAFWKKAIEGGAWTPEQMAARVKALGQVLDAAEGANRKQLDAARKVLPGPMGEPTSDSGGVQKFHVRDAATGREFDLTGKDLEAAKQKIRLLVSTGKYPKGIDGPF